MLDESILIATLAKNEDHVVKEVTSGLEAERCRKAIRLQKIRNQRQPEERLNQRQQDAPGKLPQVPQQAPPSQAQQEQQNMASLKLQVQDLQAQLQQKTTECQGLKQQVYKLKMESSSLHSLSRSAPSASLSPPFGGGVMMIGQWYCAPRMARHTQQPSTLANFAEDNADLSDLEDLPPNRYC